MILAAGLGTRLRPLTDLKPKALIEINGQTLLEININIIKSLGIKDIVINTHHFSGQVIDFIKRNNYFGINIQFIIEQELLDSGGGIKNAAWFLKDSDYFLVYNVDVVSDIDLNTMLRFHLENKPLATLAVRNRETTRYLLFDEVGRLCGWENTSTGEKIMGGNASRECKKLAFSGIHVISPEIFDLMPDKKFFSMIDCYLMLAEKYTISPFKHDTGHWFDCGKPEGLRKAGKIY